MLFSEQFKIWLDRFMVPIDDPGSRLFGWNIFFSLLLIFLYFLGQHKNLSRSMQLLHKSIFRKKYWWNRSTKKDYFLYVLNSFLKVFLFFPLLESGFWIAKKTGYALYSVYGDLPNLPLYSLSLFLFTVFAFCWDDFLRFFQHYLMHKIPLFWRWHSVHHSARVLTPFTLYRAHPMEALIATLRNSLSLGVATGVFVFCFGATLNVYTFFGVNIFGFVFNLLGSNLRHSHIPLSFGFLEVIFISPKQHQIHHSNKAEHYGKNLGVSLSLWDKIFGTHIRSKEVRNFRLGLNSPKTNSSS